MEIFIIGAGNSLKDFDFNRLKGKRLLAINTAFKDVVLTKDDILVWIDRLFYFKYKTDIDKMTCQKYVPDFTPDLAYPIKEDFNVIKSDIMFWGNEGFQRGCYCGEGGGNLTGLFAISLACALDYKPIYLLGFDGGKIRNKLHYHSRYKVERDTISAKNKLFYKIKSDDVYNCSLQSNITALPRVDIDEVLSGKSIKVIPKKIYS